MYKNYIYTLMTTLSLVYVYSVCCWIFNVPILNMPVLKFNGLGKTESGRDGFLFELNIWLVSEKKPWKQVVEWLTKGQNDIPFALKDQLLNFVCSWLAWQFKHAQCNMLKQPLPIISWHQWHFGPRRVFMVQRTQSLRTNNEIVFSHYLPNTEVIY